jgi:hypothetical protein
MSQVKDNIKIGLRDIRLEIGHVFEDVDSLDIQQDYLGRNQTLRGRCRHKTSQENTDESYSPSASPTAEAAIKLRGHRIWYRNIRSADSSKCWDITPCSPLRVNRRFG